MISNRLTSYKKITSVTLKSNNYKTVGQISVKVNGLYEPIWKYQWNIEQWSNCSVSCGIGTQTRTVNCKRIHNTQVTDIVSDSFCTKYVGTKPIISQQCNAGPCLDQIRFSARTDCGLYVLPIQVAATGASYPPLTRHPQSLNVAGGSGEWALSYFYPESVDPPYGFYVDFNSRCGGGNWVNAQLTTGGAKMYSLTRLNSDGTVPPLDSGAWVLANPYCWGGPSCRVVPYQGSPYRCGTLVGDTGDCGDILFCIVPD